MKKNFLRIVSLVLILYVLFSGCASSVAPQSHKETRVFTDSVGRKVTVPVHIISAAPSGLMAQIVLYTAAPDKLAGLASDFSTDAKKYIDKKYWSLPKFGQFYGKNASLNMEALVAAAPDVIIDIGEAKKTVKEDMDGLQRQLGIPTVFISATLDTMSQTYTMLGDLLGETERAAQLSAYCKKTISNADATTKSISAGQKVRVYMAIGESELNTNAAGSIHADVLNRVGAENVANVEAVSSGGGSKVSMEQILKWNPDVILADGDLSYKTITTGSAWKDVKAVKNGKVYRIPSSPYNFLSNPPSVNRIIGINWLGNLVYPQKYNLNIEEEVKEFYKLFYSVDLTDAQYKEIVK